MLAGCELITTLAAVPVISKGKVGRDSPEGQPVINIGRYKVRVEDKVRQYQEAILEPARLEDMPERWEFDWKGIWDRTDFEYQSIVKLSYHGSVLGLVRYAVYASADDLEFLEVLHLQSHPEERPIKPVGLWLLWYAVQAGLQYCLGTEDGTLIQLDSLEEAIPYYQDKVKMEPLGWVTLAPGEDGYGFRFTRSGAEEFCRRQSARYGLPKRL